MRIVMTGANGFLGWHTRVRIRALTGHEVIPVDTANWHHLGELVDAADAVIHLAGLGHASDHGLEDDTAGLAVAVGRAHGAPALLCARTTNAAAATTLEEVASAKGSPFTDVALPALFGEHGGPDSSFVATIAHAVVDGVHDHMQDAEVELLHVQDAAMALIEELGGRGHRTVAPSGTATTVTTVRAILTGQFEVYRQGDIPPLPSPLHVNLFNTLRAAMFPACYPIPLVRRTDLRGSLVETVRAHGSEGQTFLSTTVPGITRGQHFHLRKVERFVVVSGQARISLRKVLTDEAVDFDVDGSAPAIIDMPTLWAHKITNTGDSELTTMFWTNELFDPQDADTYPEEV